eukprot:2817071-Rhodomonas_salina.1
MTAGSAGRSRRAAALSCALSRTPAAAMLPSDSDPPSTPQSYPPYRSASQAIRLGGPLRSL